MGLVTVIKLDPYKFSSDLNPLWIQKHSQGCSQIFHGTHIKFKLEFNLHSNLMYETKKFSVGPNDYELQSQNHNLKTTYQTPSWVFELQVYPPAIESKVQPSSLLFFFGGKYFREKNNFRGNYFYFLIKKILFCYVYDFKNGKRIS